MEDVQTCPSSSRTSPESAIWREGGMDCVPQPELLHHLHVVRTLLASESPPDQTQLQQTLLKIASSASGQMDETSKSFGAHAILSLLQGNYSSKYQPVFGLLEKLNYSPDRVISMLEAALAIQASAECESPSNKGSFSTMLAFPQVSSSAHAELGMKQVHAHRRTLLVPEMFTPVLNVLFAVQVSNPLLRNMQLLCKQYLDHELILDMPASGQIGLWWGPNVREDLLWVSAVWTCALRASTACFAFSENSDPIMGSSCVSMRIIGQMMNTLLLFSDCSSAVDLPDPVSLHSIHWMRPPTLSYDEILMRKPPHALDSADDQLATFYLNDQVIINAIHHIHRCFTKLFSSEALPLKSIEPGSNYSLQINSSMQHLCLSLHASQWLDVIMYYALTRRSSSTSHKIGECEGKFHEPGAEGIGPDTLSHSSPTLPSCGTKRKISDDQSDGNSNNSRDSNHCKDAIEVLIFSNCQGIRLKTEVESSGNCEIFFKNLSDALSSETTGTASVISLLQHRYYQLKKCLKDFLLQRNKEIDPMTSIQNDEKLIGESYLQFLLLILFRCTLLEMLFLTPPSPTSTSCQRTALFYDLCEFCLVNKKQDQHPHECQDSSQCMGGMFSSTRDCSSYLLIIILNEVQMFTCANSFKTFLTCLVQEQTATTGRSGSHNSSSVRNESRSASTCATVGDDGGSEHIKYDPCGISKIFLMKQLNTEDSPFSLLVQAVQKSESQNNMEVAETLKKILIV